MPMIKMIVFIPRRGMRRNPERNVPIILPIAAVAYMLPTVFPTLVDSSMAYFAITGDIVPRVVDGRKKSTKMFTSERITILLMTMENSPSLIILSRMPSKIRIR